MTYKIAKHRVLSAAVLGALVVVGSVARGTASAGEYDKLNDIGPAPLPVISSKLPLDTELDHIQTGGDDVSSTREEWLKRRQQERNCDNCGLKQAFPGDVEDKPAAIAVDG